jgi:hypothetical protein
MKGTFKILAGVAVLFVMVAAAAPASAQCAAARTFGGGGMAPRIRVDTTPFQNTGQDLSRIWEAGVTSNNSGSVAPGQGSCPSDGTGQAQAWWFHGNAQTQGSLRWINGFISQTGCEIQVCPGVGASLTTLVEDQTADGADAGYIIYTVDETTAAGSAKRYDHARTGTGAATTDHVMVSYPTVVIGGSTGPPPNTTITAAYSDLGAGFHGASLAFGVTIPASSSIDSYDIMARDSGDPDSRLRSDWNFVKSVPYGDQAVVGDTVVVPCPNGANGATVLAVGATFDGLASALVGSASLPVQCDPNIAEPDADGRNSVQPKRKSLRGSRSRSTKR